MRSKKNMHPEWRYSEEKSGMSTAKNKSEVSPVHIHKMSGRVRGGGG